MDKRNIILISLLLLAVTVLVTSQTNVVNLKDWVKVQIVSPETDYYMEVAQGNIPGTSSINKFGHNSAATSGDDVWGGGGVYDFYPTTAQSMEIVSTSGLDTGAGNGARTVIVFGLDENWSEISETITLNGLTPVSLNNTYIRMYRAVVLTIGTTDSNVGDITVEIQGDTTVALFIGANEGQTQQAIYTVPEGKVGYFVKGYVAMADDDKFGEVAEFQWQARTNNGAIGAWQVKGEVGLNTVGTSAWQYEYGIPAGMIPEKTDIRIKVISTTATLGVVGGFDFVLVDNE